MGWNEVMNHLEMSRARCCEWGCWRCPVAPAAVAAARCCWRRLWSAAAPTCRWWPSAAVSESEAAPSPPGISSAPPASARPCLSPFSPELYEGGGGGGKKFGTKVRFNAELLRSTRGGLTRFCRSACWFRWFGQLVAFLTCWSTENSQAVVAQVELYDESPKRSEEKKFQHSVTQMFSDFEYCRICCRSVIYFFFN